MDDYQELYRHDRAVRERFLNVFRNLRNAFQDVDGVDVRKAIGTLQEKVIAPFEQSLAQTDVPEPSALHGRMLFPELIAEWVDLAMGLRDWQRIHRDFESFLLAHRCIVELGKTAKSVQEYQKVLKKSLASVGHVKCKFPFQAVIGEVSLVLDQACGQIELVEQKWIPQFYSIRRDNVTADTNALEAELRSLFKNEKCWPPVAYVHLLNELSLKQNNKQQMIAFQRDAVQQSSAIAKEVLSVVNGSGDSIPSLVMNKLLLLSFVCKAACNWSESLETYLPSLAKFGDALLEPDGLKADILTYTSAGDQANFSRDYTHRIDKDEELIMPQIVVSSESPDVSSFDFVPGRVVLRFPFDPLAQAMVDLDDLYPPEAEWLYNLIEAKKIKSLQEFLATADEQREEFIDKILDFVGRMLVYRDLLAVNNAQRLQNIWDALAKSGISFKCLDDVPDASQADTPETVRVLTDTDDEICTTDKRWIKASRYQVSFPNHVEVCFMRIVGVQIADQQWTLLSDQLRQLRRSTPQWPHWQELEEIILAVPYRSLMKQERIHGSEWIAPLLKMISLLYFEHSETYSEDFLRAFEFAHNLLTNILKVEVYPFIDANSNIRPVTADEFQGVDLNWEISDLPFGTPLCRSFTKLSWLKTPLLSLGADFPDSLERYVTIVPPQFAEEGPLRLLLTELYKAFHNEVPWKPALWEGKIVRARQHFGTLLAKNSKAINAECDRIFKAILLDPAVRIWIDVLYELNVFYPRVRSCSSQLFWPTDVSTYGIVEAVCGDAPKGDVIVTTAAELKFSTESKSARARICIGREDEGINKAICSIQKWILKDKRPYEVFQESTDPRSSYMQAKWSVHLFCAALFDLQLQNPPFKSAHELKSLMAVIRDKKLNYEDVFHNVLKLLLAISKSSDKDLFLDQETWKSIQEGLKSLNCEIVPTWSPFDDGPELIPNRFEFNDNQAAQIEVLELGLQLEGQLIKAADIVERHGPAPAGYRDLMAALVNCNCLKAEEIQNQLRLLPKLLAKANINESTGKTKLVDMLKLVWSDVHESGVKSESVLDNCRALMNAFDLELFPDEGEQIRDYANDITTFFEIFNKGSLSHSTLHNGQISDIHRQGLRQSSDNGGGRKVILKAIISVG